MENLTAMIETFEAKADLLSASVIANWEMVKEEQPGNERLLHLAATAVEFAHIYRNAVKSSMSLGLYCDEGNSDGAASGLHEAYQAFDYVHTKTPNDRTKAATDLAYQGLEAVRNRDVEKASAIMRTFADIAIASRETLLDIEQERLALVTN
ncbi:hypothetical protein ACFYU8_31190 [Brevibacillus sp. NPDC003359]|uniref:hypothetical protein n=1 Tax=unclassified Brevibacillus TaxID=2684853 RepID=UPI0036A147E7